MAKRRDSYQLPADHKPPMPYAGQCPLCGANHGDTTFTSGPAGWGYYCQPHCFANKKAPDESGAEVIPPK